MTIWSIMIGSAIEYTERQSDFSKSRGANQGEWIICDSQSSIEFIAAKDAGPCILIFMHGQDRTKPKQYAAVAHISVAEKIESISEMLTAMHAYCDSIQISLISGLSKADSQFALEVINFLQKLSYNFTLQIDLGDKTTKAVMEVQTGSIWQQQDIPKENYQSFNPDTYFKLAILSIFNKNLKRDLKNVLDKRSVESNNSNLQIVPYRPNPFLPLFVITLPDVTNYMSRTSYTTQRQVKGKTPGNLNY